MTTETTAPPDGNRLLTLWRPSGTLPGRGSTPLEPMMADGKRPRCPCQTMTDHGRWSSTGQCGNAAKHTVLLNGAEVAVCGVHYRTVTQHYAKEAARIAEREATDATERAVRDLCAQLAAQGIEADPHYATYSRRYTGDVVVDPVALLRVLAARDLAP